MNEAKYKEPMGRFEDVKITPEGIEAKMVLNDGYEWSGICFFGIPIPKRIDDDEFFEERD